MSDDVLAIHHDLITSVSALKTATQQAITKLLEAQKLNETMQKKCERGSPDWHMHETIDDRINDALVLLGH